MKRKKKAAKKVKSLAASAGPALRRAAKVARRIAKMHGLPVCFIKDGKIVNEYP